MSDSVKLGEPKNPVETAVKRAFGGKNTNRYFIGEGTQRLSEILNLNTHSLNINCGLSKKIQQRKNFLAAFQPLRKLHLIRKHRFHVNFAGCGDVRSDVRRLLNQLVRILLA